MAFPFEYPSDVATLLAQICCHRNELPQGAPTSPIVSNFICRRMDTQIARLSRDERCYYSRYADDLCFSTDRTTFPSSLASVEDGVATVGPALMDVIVSNGFRVNATKTRLMKDSQRQRVTGLVVNRRLSVPREYIRGLRLLLYVWKTNGEDAAVDLLKRGGTHANWPPDKPKPEFRLVVRGRVQYVGAIKGWSHPVYIRLARSLRDLDPDFRPTTRQLPEGSTVDLFTEGISDIAHMIAAERYFHSRGEFTDLSLAVNSQSDRGSDAELLKQCDALSRTPQRSVCVCLFDRDNPQILRQATSDKDWRNWGNGVVAVALAAPAWRDGPVCIEMLHTDEVLRRRDAKGRRVYLASEFDRRTGQHVSELCNTPNPQSRTLVREQVFEVGSGESIGLSKTAFGEAISEPDERYADINFEGFRTTFEVIRQAARAATADLASD